MGRLTRQEDAGPCDGQNVTMSVTPTIIAAGWSWGWRGRPGTALPRHRRVEVDILFFIGSKPMVSTGYKPSQTQTVRKTTRCRHRRAAGPIASCVVFPASTPISSPLFLSEGAALPPCGQGLKVQPDRANKEAVGCPVLNFLRVRRPGGPGKSVGLPATRASRPASRLKASDLNHGQTLSAARDPVGSPHPGRR